MFRWRVHVSVLVACALMLTAAVEAKPAKPEKMEKKVEKALVKVTRNRDAYCFDQPIVWGNIVVTGGRCYTFYLVRTTSGGFLAFGPPGPPMIPPGQLVRMNTPAGAKTKGRLFYMVPLPRPVTIIPVETIQYVPVVVVPQPGQVVIKVPPTTSGSPSGPGQEKEIELAFLQR